MFLFFSKFNFFLKNDFDKKRLRWFNRVWAITKYMGVHGWSWKHNPVCKDKQWLKDYLRWNIEHLYDKWQPELPDIKIVLQGVKEWNETFYPRATCDKKNYMDFLLSCKNEINNNNNMQDWEGSCIVFLVFF